MRTCPQCQSYLLGSDSRCGYCKAELPPEAPTLEAAVPTAPVPAAAVEASPGLATLESVFGDAARPEPAPRPAPRPEPAAVEPAPAPPPPPLGADRRWLPLVASMVLPGAGQLIKGQPVRAYVALAAFALMTWFDWTVLGLIIWIVQVYDASQPQANAAFENALVEARRKLSR